MALLGAPSARRSGLLGPGIQQAAARSSESVAQVLKDDQGGRLPVAIGLLLFALLLPTEMSLNLAGLRLTPYRIVLLTTFFSSIRTVRSGLVGRPILADKAIAAFGAWALFALLLREGPQRAIESGGIFIAESLGAYYLARAHVRDAADLIAVGKGLFVGMVILSLLAIPEMLTGQRIVHDVAGAIFGGRQDTLVEGRLGLSRAYGPFDHPILYGTFCAAAFSLSRVLSGRRPDLVKDTGRSALVAFAALASLSSGCIMAVMFQAGLATYGAVLRQVASRWKLLTAACLGAYALISALSDRSGLKAVLWYVTLSRDTAAYRIMIWEHAGENIWRHPLVGIGLENWIRPTWMPESVDSFWLVLSLSYGLPAVALLAVACLWLMARVGRRPLGCLAERRLRSAWCLTFAALLFTGFTVHYWNNVFVLFFFMLGCGGWMARDAEQGA